MFGAHLPELAIVLVLGLIVFGPKRVPEIGSALGRGIRDFKQGVAGITEPAVSESLEEIPVHEA